MPSQKELRELFDYDEESGELTRKVSISSRARAGDIVGSGINYRVIPVTINGKGLLAHRVIWAWVHGNVPSDMVIDHIDHDSKNNRLSNLRLVTQQENCRNYPLKKTNTSGVNGVYWSTDKKKWAVEVMLNRKKHFIGRFDSFEIAKQVRQDVDRQYGFHLNHGTVIHGN